jgi:CCR4-NOT transcription complex subunit 7/8
MPSPLQDTEFPGIVARPIGTFKTGSDYHFQTMRCNVDLLKIIQLGITLADEEGNMPEVCCWQFNFKFSLRWVSWSLTRTVRVGWQELTWE